jgi:hypothetical protein
MQRAGKDAPAGSTGYFAKHQIAPPTIASSATEIASDSANSFMDCQTDNKRTRELFVARRNHRVCDVLQLSRSPPPEQWRLEMCLSN